MSYNVDCFVELVKIYPIIPKYFKKLFRFIFYLRLTKTDEKVSFCSFLHHFFVVLKFVYFMFITYSKAICVKHIYTYSTRVALSEKHEKNKSMTCSSETRTKTKKWYETFNFDSSNSLTIQNSTVSFM